jgi:hypothetical protein
MRGVRFFSSRDVHFVQTSPATITSVYTTPPGHIQAPPRDRDRSPRRELSPLRPHPPSGDQKETKDGGSAAMRRLRPAAIGRLNMGDLLTPVDFKIVDPTAALLDAPASRFPDILSPRRGAGAGGAGAAGPSPKSLATDFMRAGPGSGAKPAVLNDDLARGDAKTGDGVFVIKGAVQEKCAALHSDPLLGLVAQAFCLAGPLRRT